MTSGKEEALMAFWKKDYNKPGPGVPKNAPRKKGIPRFFEILGRDGGNILKLNMLVFLCLLPSMLFFVLGIVSFGSGSGFWMLIFFALALIASVLVGPARTVEAFLITKILRDDPGYIWHDFKLKFKENFKTMVFPGVLYSILIGMQVFTAIIALASEQKVSVIWFALYLLSVLLVAMAAPYYFLQAAYLDLKPLPMLKNSLFLALGFLPRSFMGGVISLLFALIQILAIYIFPALAPIIVFVPFLVGISFPTLMTMMWDWPQVDKTFNIEKTLKERQQKKETEDATMAQEETKQERKEEREKAREEKHDAKVLKDEKRDAKLEKDFSELAKEGLAIETSEDPSM